MVDDDTEMQEMTQAHYCIVEGNLNSKERSSLSITFVRVPYDIKKELELAVSNEIPDYDQYESELLKAKYRGKNKKILEELKNNN